MSAAGAGFYTLYFGLSWVSGGESARAFRIISLVAGVITITFGALGVVVWRWAESMSGDNEL